jgi:glycosyltransferase involved in cell wall biosynthesis
MTTTMRVAFDSQIFCAQQFGGISRYFAAVAREMTEMTSVQPHIVAPLHINDYLGHLPRGVVHGRKISASWIGKLLARAASATAGSLTQLYVKPDVVHETYYYPQVRLWRRARTVVSVYDMNYERFPQYFPANDPIPRWKAQAVARADHVICISEHTRRDLLEMCNVPPQRVSVTYLGYDALTSIPSRERPAAFRTRLFEADRPYLLYVGSRTGCKNFPALVHAFASSAWLTGQFGLLCFGGGAFTAVERALFAQLKVDHLVRHASGPDAVLADSYRSAALFVYPSLYEGFGIPPLEAMSLDCPVACSNASSIPEVVGDAAALFDPSDVEAMRATLESVLQSQSLRAQLVERGKARKDIFSWRRCARETVAIYDTILSA